MKLYLSSYRIGSKPEVLAESFGENKKVAVIANAMDFAADNERVEKVAGSMEGLSPLGLIPEEVDLRDYFGKPDELKQKLDEYGGAWVRGGNVFILRRAMAYSGMDIYIEAKISNIDFVYGGYSAGVCLLGPSLCGLEIVDDPERVPEKYQPETIWEGLGILNYIIIPHYKSDHPESARVDKTVEYLIANNVPYKALRDGEVIVGEIVR